MKAVVCNYCLAASILVSSQIALSQSEVLKEGSDQVASEVSSEVVAPVVNQLPAKFVSDGSSIALPDLDVSIVPPKGWEVITSSPTLSLIMQEVKEEKAPLAKNQEPAYEYQRNITVAVIKHPDIMDERRAKKLETELVESFGAKSSSGDYRVVEHKFFDYRSNQQGIIVYTAFVLNSVEMMQMHVLVSGSNEQFLLTYTDMASTFSTEALFNEAWATMTSIEVTGTPSMMLNPMLAYGIPAAIVVLLIFVLAMLKYKSANYTYSDDELDIYKDEPYTDLAITQTNMWNLKSAKSMDETAGVSFVTNL